MAHRKAVHRRQIADDLTRGAFASLDDDPPAWACLFVPSGLAGFDVACELFDIGDAQVSHALTAPQRHNMIVAAFNRLLLGECLHRLTDSIAALYQEDRKSAVEGKVGSV